MTIQVTIRHADEGSAAALKVTVVTVAVSVTPPEVTV